MRNSKIYIVVIIIAVIAALFAYQYIFSIYEVTYSVDKTVIFADNGSTAEIRVVPVNAFGWKAPFRTSSAIFDIREGRDLIEIVTENREDGLLVIKSKGLPGKVVIMVKSKHSLLPSPIEITIEPPLV